MFLLNELFPLFNLMYSYMVYARFGFFMYMILYTTLRWWQANMNILFTYSKYETYTFISHIHSYIPFPAMSQVIEGDVDIQ